MDEHERAILDEVSPRKHILERTSPKGGPFRGTCVRCGQTELPAVAARALCDGDLILEGQ